MIPICHQTNLITKKFWGQLDAGCMTWNKEVIHIIIKVNVLGTMLASKRNFESIFLL